LSLYIDEICGHATGQVVSCHPLDTQQSMWDLWW